MPSSSYSLVGKPPPTACLLVATLWADNIAPISLQLGRPAALPHLQIRPILCPPLNCFLLYGQFPSGAFLLNAALQVFFLAT